MFTALRQTQPFRKADAPPKRWQPQDAVDSHRRKAGMSVLPDAEQPAQAVRNTMADDQSMTLAQQLASSFPLQQVVTPGGVVSYRRAGAGPAMVLLHGIGSASGSWLSQLQGLKATHTVLAWDAPGYGQSDQLQSEKPEPRHYGARVWDWVDALGLDGRPVTLVGHSLGALMAASATTLQPDRVARLVLLSPAQGYGRADVALRETKLRDRLNALQAHGPQGLAELRGRAMVSSGAEASLVEYIKTIMAQIRPDGYTQAAHMLAGAHLAKELQDVRCPILVASGTADTITPRDGCENLARELGAPYRTLGPIGHACALEAAATVNQLLMKMGKE